MSDDDYELRLLRDRLDGAVTELEQLRAALSAEKLAHEQCHEALAEAEAEHQKTLEAALTEEKIHQECRRQAVATGEAQKALAHRLEVVLAETQDRLTSLRQKAQAVVDAWSEHELEAALMGLRDELAGKGGGE